jgi:sec-independent protein translocase protein TatA
MLRNIGPLEWVIILIVVVLIFGAGKLPQLGRSLGEGIKEFRKSVKEISTDSTKDEETGKKS